MKLTIDRDTLADAATWAARTIPNRPPTPILTGVHIHAEAETVELRAFDYETSARTTVPAQVETPGTVVVSGRLLAEVVKALPAKPVTIELDGPVLHVKCGAAKFKLLTMPADDFPDLPPVPETVGTLDPEVFEHAVTQVATAASRDESLPLLCAVNVEFTPGLITLLATDRYRLAIREVPWDGTIEAGALLRAKALTEASKSLHGPVTLHEGKTFGFSTTTRTLTTTSIEGDYPAVRRLIPDETTTTAVVSRAELMDAVKRVAIVADRGLPVRLAFTDGDVTLHAGAGDDATASETLPADLTGTDIEVAFNPQYLIDGLQAFDTTQVRLGLTHPFKPVLFTGQSDDGTPVEAFRYLLVPIRVAAR